MRWVGMTTGLKEVSGPTGSTARLASWAVLLVVLLAAFGCDDDDEYVDVTPPAIPAGVSSITADDEVILYWYPNRERDLKGYRIWWNEDGGNEFERIADIGAFDPDYYDPGSGPGDDFMLFSDFGIPNGSVNYYAVSAYDDLGNESDLSLEFVYDVPRPEGIVTLQEAAFNAAQAGFDFSRADVDGTPQDYTLASTDLFYQVGAQGGAFLVVNTSQTQREIRIQDYGFTGFDGLSFAPGSGYSARDRVEAIPGHAYAIEILTNPGGSESLNYAKVWVEALTPTQVVLWWGYQEVEGEPQLKNPVAGGESAGEEVRR